MCPVSVIASLLTSELVKSLKPTPVAPLYGNGTVDVSWLT